MDVYEEADLYCAAFSWPLDEEVDWLLRAVPGVRRVFEPFCGNARYGPLFAERGVEYHGLDLSASMLERAPKSEGIHVHLGDARTFRLAAPRFELAWCPVNSVRHLISDDDVVRHLECVRSMLAPGGAYVLELELVDHDGPWTWRPEHGGDWAVPQPDGSVVQARWRRESCDRRRRTCRERATFRHVAEGAVREETEHLYEMRMWTMGDLLRLTSAAGLRISRAHLSDADLGRPEVAVSPAAVNDGQNRCWFLVPV
jgi:SAM-dependent methyltransferase